MYCSAITNKSISDSLLNSETQAAVIISGGLTLRARALAVIDQY